MYPHGTSREVAYEIEKKCNLQNGDMAAFCIVGPYYDVTSPCFSIRSYAVAVEDNALYLAEYDYLNPSTFPDSVSYMSVIGKQTISFKICLRSAVYFVAAKHILRKAV